MLVDLVQVTTADGMRLDGALETPPTNTAAAPAVDVWLCLHGTGSNFYSATLLASLAPRLMRLGAAVLRVNTRGHHLVYLAATTQGRRLQGAAFEIVDESRHDVTAWIEWLAERGFRRIGVLGHSLGGVKAIYTLAQESLPVSALVAVSPPRLSHAHFLTCARGEEFRQTFATAEWHVGAGRPHALLEVTFPLPYMVTAAAYLDRYGREERYNVLRYGDRLPCPTLFTYGTRELQSDAAFAGMPEALEPLRTPKNLLQVAVIAGADHNYTGVQGDLADRIESWVPTA